MNMDASKSVYMSSAEVVKKKIIGYIELKIMDRRMFWKDQEEELQVTYEVIQMTIEQFLKIGIILPLIEEKQLNSEFSIEFMKKYTEFLGKIYPEEFKKTMKKIKKQLYSSTHSDSSKLSSTLSSPKASSGYKISIGGVFKYI